MTFPCQRLSPCVPSSSLCTLHCLRLLLCYHLQQQWIRCAAGSWGSILLCPALMPQFARPSLALHCQSVLHPSLTNCTTVSRRNTRARLALRSVQGRASRAASSIQSTQQEQSWLGAVPDTGFKLHLSSLLKPLPSKDESPGALSSVLMLRGRAPEEHKQAPGHMIWRCFGQLASAGLVLEAEGCRKAKSQEKLALPPPLFVRQDQHRPTQLRAGAQERWAPGRAETAAESAGS